MEKGFGSKRADTWSLYSRQIQYCRLLKQTYIVFLHPQKRQQIHLKHLVLKGKLIKEIFCSCMESVKRDLN